MAAGKRKQRSGGSGPRRGRGKNARIDDLDETRNDDLYEVDAEDDARAHNRNRKALEAEEGDVLNEVSEDDSDREIAEEDDEEIDSDEAFDSEDEKKFADFDFARYGSGKGNKRGAGGSESGSASELDSSSEEEEEDSEDEQRHQEMLANLRQMREESERPEGRSGAVAPKLGDESQQGALTLSDLVGTWKDSEDKPSSRSRKLERSLKRMAPTAAPLPKVVQDRNERKAAYSITSKDVSKWQNIVKANREARTLEFSNRQAANLQVVSTTSAVANNVRPETDMEREIAEMLGEDASDAGAEDLLQGNALSKEEAKERQAKLAKMRSVLFYQDQKARRLKAIKSKRHHKYLKSVERRKIEKEGVTMDPETMMKEAEHAEFLRARERLTLKHKNTSKWAKHALQRGFHRLDENTKAALSEQNQISEALRRKANYRGDEGSSESESESETGGSQDGGAGKKAVEKINSKAKAEVLRLLEENPDAEVPKKGLFALPFMRRAMSKQREQARQNAEDFLMELEDEEEDSEGNAEAVGGEAENAGTGKVAFGGKARRALGKKGNGNDDEGEDSESESSDASQDEDEAQPEEVEGKGEKNGTLAYGHTVSAGGRSKDKVFVASKLEVPVGKQREAKNGAAPKNQGNPSSRKAGTSKKSNEEEDLYLEEAGDGPHMSQRQIVAQAFGAFGDDVQTDFQEEKMQSVAEELPTFEEPADLPGWGKWEGDRKTPKWILKARAKAEEQRKEAISSRQDRKLKHVVISEKYDKKASKYTTQAVPFPFKRREDYERSIRTPLGSDFNSEKSHWDLTRPEILTTTGVRIDPLRYTKTNSHPRKEGGISGSRRVL